MYRPYCLIATKDSIAPVRLTMRKSESAPSRIKVGFGLPVEAGEMLRVEERDPKGRTRTLEQAAPKDGMLGFGEFRLEMN